MDGGGDHFKVSMSMMQPKGTRRHAKKKYKDTGVKEMIPIAIIAGVEEEYHIVKEILDRININIKKNGGVFAMDIKLINIVLGIMSASSSYPCPYCEIFHDFRETPTPPLQRTVENMR